MFEKLEGRIVGEYKVKVRSDLHIGSGETTAPGEVDMAVLKDSMGFPIIPGSSLKGVLRSDMERLLLAFFDGDKATRDEVVGLIFGSSRKSDDKVKGLASSVRVGDSTTNTKRTAIRDGVAISRATRKVEGSKKYDIEVVPRGVEFTGRYIIENPDIVVGDERYKNAKYGALCRTVRFFNDTNGSLGGGTSRGFGEVELELSKVELYTAEYYIKGNDAVESVDIGEAEAEWVRFLTHKKNSIEA